MPALRTIKLLLAAVICLFVIAATYISILVVERQNALKQVSRYNVAWLVSQASTEFARLEQRLSALDNPSTGVSEDEVQLRSTSSSIGCSSWHRATSRIFSPKTREQRDRPAARHCDRRIAADDRSARQARDGREGAAAAGAARRQARKACRVGKPLRRRSVAEDQHQLIRLHWLFSGLAAGWPCAASG